MAKDLTPGTTTEKNKLSTAPINILKIEYGGVIGTKFYSDRPLASPVSAEGRVSDWGNISQAFVEDQNSTIDDLTLILNDSDLVIRGYAQSVGLERKRVTVFQWFEGLAFADLTPMMVGMINSPVNWIEQDATISFDMTDISTLRDKPIGTIVDKELFPYRADDDQDKMIPIVFGSVKRSTSVHVKAGSRTELIKKLTLDDMVLYVSDSQGMPQDSTVELIIDNEIVKGSFSGKTFTIDERNVSFENSTTTHLSSSAWRIKDASLPGPLNQYTNLFVKITIPGNATPQYRQIIGSENDELILKIPFYSGGELFQVLAGTEYEITSYGENEQGAHEPGTEVVLLLDEYVWILNDTASKSITKVEVWGTKYKSVDFEDKESQRQDVSSEQEGWVPLDPNSYIINKNDSTTFPTLGHAVTTLKMTRNPKDIPDTSYTNNKISCDIDGVESVGDGSGTLITNPSDIIKVILKRWLGLIDSDLDLNSFEDTRIYLEEFFLEMGFTVKDQWQALRLIADIAFQARSSITWEAGIAHLHWLTNSLPTPVVTDIEDIDRAESSIEMEFTNFESIITEINITYLERGEEKNETIKDTTAESLFGRKTKDISFFTYSERKSVLLVARFWLNRWKQNFEMLRLTMFLRKFELERGDVVRLELPGHYTDQKADVIEIANIPGSGEAREIDKMEVLLRVPVRAGCESKCEMDCETGCEDVCELTDCQSDCQESCEKTGCEVDCQEDCELFCQETCEFTCVTDCESTCQVGCQGGGCQAECELACQTQDEQCQLTCEYSCVVGCETSCQSGCQSDCEIGCESDCASFCQMGCESECQDSCQFDCQVEGCQLGCEESGCQGGSCQYDCQAECQSDCQETCETTCQTASEADNTHVPFAFVRGDGSSTIFVFKNVQGEEINWKKNWDVSLPDPSTDPFYKLYDIHITRNGTELKQLQSSDSPVFETTGSFQFVVATNGKTIIINEPLINSEDELYAHGSRKI